MIEPNKIDKAVFVVTKKMCRKVYPVIKPGDKILIDLKWHKPAQGQFILISNNEDQWIERYNRQPKKINYYPVIKIIIED